MLEDRAERNKLRHVVLKAEKEEIITKDEVAFIIEIIENGRKEIDKKAARLMMLKGEILQAREDRSRVIETRKAGPLSNTPSQIVGLISTKLEAETEKKKSKWRC
jgi:hypothetical protein